MAVGITGGAALSVAAILFVTMAATSMISGGHFNPAITLGVMVRDFLDCKFDLTDILVRVVYIILQIVGGIVGALLAWAIRNSTMYLHYDDDNVDSGQAFLGELVFTTLLVWVFLSSKKYFLHTPLLYMLVVATAQYAGIQIVSGVSSGFMNFAISLGIKVVDAGEHDSDDLDDIWIYLLGFLFGGALGAVLYWVHELGKQKAKAPS
eukprot:CAMPEP_0168316870 /NCGR_PEP_ID=MMETSP0210-20121227/20147_1 /TAXON_ID=40633 /ORGANISM="Condylostoma magnum, Strain COL2" /LENGTH=206 /DNA_ID=CAMNT_0008306407 /DNA_START=14 /DNA_END=634 /DNA_ORIENTATION=+